MRKSLILLMSGSLLCSASLMARTPPSSGYQEKPGDQNQSEVSRSADDRRYSRHGRNGEGHGERDMDGRESTPPQNRSYVDNPDPTNKPTIHFIYAVPSGGVDRGLDLTTTIPFSASSFNNWLASQTGGRKLRFDLYRNHLDITFAKLPRTDAAYESFAVFKRDQIEADIKGLGLTKPNKLYVVYYEGTNPRACADAPRPPGLAGQMVVMYLHGLEGLPRVRPCADNPFAASPTAAPGYLDFSALHEILHAHGIVSDGAPHFTLNGHVSDSPSDLMYAGTESWSPSILDFNKDDYYNPAGLPAGIINFANSPYLTNLD